MLIQASAVLIQYCVPHTGLSPRGCARRPFSPASESAEPCSFSRARQQQQGRRQGWAKLGRGATVGALTEAMRGTGGGVNIGGIWREGYRKE